MKKRSGGNFGRKCLTECIKFSGPSLCILQRTIRKITCIFSKSLPSIISKSTSQKEDSSSSRSIDPRIFQFTLSDVFSTDPDSNQLISRIFRSIISRITRTAIQISQNLQNNQNPNYFSLSITAFFTTLSNPINFLLPRDQS